MTTSAVKAPLSGVSAASSQLDTEETLERSDATNSDPAESMESLQKRNSELEKELQTAQVDAKETLLALLQMAEGVRVITRHMKSASHEIDDSVSEEVKSEELTEQLFSDSIVRETCLRGTVFGTDLLRLWDAAHHVRDYARMVSKETSLSVEDVIQAQATAQEALDRAEKAEGAVRSLQVQNNNLKAQLSKTSSERRVLLNEVKSLRHNMAASRKIEMQRLLRQHVEGALLLHEDQLKAMAAQHRSQKHAEEEKKDEEELELVQSEDCAEVDTTPSVAVGESSAEKAAEKDDTKESPKSDISVTLADIVATETSTSQLGITVEVPEEKESKSNNDGDNHVKEEDVVTGQLDKSSLPESLAVPDVTYSVVPSEPKMAENKSFEVPRASAGGGSGILGFGSKFHQSWARSKPAEQLQSQTQTASEADDDRKECKKEDPKRDNLKAPVNTPANASSATTAQDTANKENKHLAANHQDPIQSSTSESSKTKAQDSANPETTSYSPVKLFASFGRTPPAPPQYQEQMVQKPESSRSVGSTGSTESSGGGPGVGTKVINFLFHPEKIHHYPQVQAPPKPVVEAAVSKKSNALLKLTVSEDSAEKGGPSVDETAATTAATPASSCEASRTRTLSGENNKCVTTGQQHKSVSSPIRIVPGSVSWSEDNQSIQSNLPSPQFQYSPKDIALGASGNNVPLGTGVKTVELYKDLKVFQSLAIPNDDEIDDYHYYRHQYQQELPNETKP